MNSSIDHLCSLGFGVDLNHLLIAYCLCRVPRADAGRHHGGPIYNIYTYIYMSICADLHICICIMNIHIHIFICIYMYM